MDKTFFKSIICSRDLSLQKKNSLNNLCWWKIHCSSLTKNKIKDRFNPRGQRSYFKKFFMGRFSLRKYQALGLVPLKKK